MLPVLIVIVLTDSFCDFLLAMPRGTPINCKLHSSCTARCSFFTERVVNIWNSLPVNADFLSLSGFIQQINRMDFLAFRAFNAVFTLSRLSFYRQLLQQLSVASLSHPTMSFCSVTHCNFRK